MPVNGLQLNADEEHKKRCLYRAWWAKRNQPTMINKRITHSEKFAQLYGETLEQYHERLGAMSPEHRATMEFQRAGR